MSRYSDDGDLITYAITIALTIYVCFISWIHQTKLEEGWLRVSPPGSHVEYYSESPWSEYNNKPKVVFPDGRTWLPDKEVQPKWNSGSAFSTSGH